MSEIVNHKTLFKKSENVYDWLGPGIYFWENSPSRALEYANILKNNPSRSKQQVTTPGIIGAVIDLGHCLDLLDYENLQILKRAYEFLKKTYKTSELPQNKPVGSSTELLLRDLDCNVIKTVHDIQADSGLKPFDSIRAVFSEGEEIYPNAGFRAKNHIQLCICNPNCIKGFFIPRELDEKFAKV